MTMRFALALAVVTVAVLPATAADAQAPIWYWCDTWQAYYPRVVSCPVPWRAVGGSTTGVPQSAAQPSASEEPTRLPPQVPRSSFPTLGDGLDDWCAQVKMPSSIALCSDRELRALALERQHAYDEAKASLSVDQQKTLLADQNSWVKSYAAACGLSQDAAPSLPLAPAVKGCMAQAGRARIDYLRAYGPTPSASGQALPQSEQAQTPPAGAASAPARIGPSFDCNKTAQPLAALICASPALSKLDLQFVQAYQALRQLLGAVGQQQLRQEAVDFQQSVLRTCGVPKTGPVSGSVDCVAAQHYRQRSLWLSRLRGSANEEAVRPIEQHIALQAQLQKLGFLPSTDAIDGVYGETTRAAILAWQRTNGRIETGLIGNADATALGGATEPQATEATPGRAQDVSRAEGHGSAGANEATPERVTSPAAAPSDQRSANERDASDSPELPVLVIGPVVVITLIIIIIFKRYTKQILTRRVLKATYGTVNQHKRALVRRRFQILRHDDYGNLLIEPWHKELYYFMNKVIDPVVRQIGPKEYSLYEAMRPAILLTIAGFVEQQVGSSESFTLGPLLSG
jgi:uncharacterized protein/peptidoglycan hydrolase-like protein with peptidoglycan-binding domain